MENKFKVSVMITFYNQEKYVDETLGSVFSQKTDFNFEVIVGDDGSNDNTIEKVKVWQEKYPNRIRIFIMDRETDKKYEAIERVSKNRLNMLKNCESEYGIFLDGDDVYLDDNKLQKQVDLLDDNKDAVACGHPVVCFSEDSDETSLLGKITNKNVKISGKNFWKFYYLHSDSLLFRNVLGEDEVNLKHNFDDNTIILHYIEKGKKIIYLNDALAGYRQLPNSSWNKRSELERIFINLKDYVEEKENFSRLKKASFIRHFFELKTLKKKKKEIDDLGKYKDYLLRDKFIRRTVEYKNKNVFFKAFYIIRYAYFFPCLIYIKFARKFSQIKMKLFNKTIKDV